MCRSGEGIKVSTAGRWGGAEGGAGGGVSTAGRWGEEGGAGVKVSTAGRWGGGQKAAQEVGSPRSRLFQDSAESTPK